ncbi:hypothetical protein F4X86_02550 [Candidatus Saccharibacteria bacterium]|nr:hypothetical protein [Candidatus Saccharibacteria bacterium]
MTRRTFNRQQHADHQPALLPGFDYFWQYAAERQRVYHLQLTGRKPLFTDNPVISTYRFTNVYRAADRVSQHLINRVQYDDNWDWPDTFARTMVFKLFNRIDTWRYLVEQLGQPRLADLAEQRIDKALASIAGARPLYNPAYVMPPPRQMEGPKFKRHLDLLRLMIRDKAPQLIKGAKTMEEAFNILRAYPSVGDFLAYQFIIDLNYSRHLQFSENEFVVAGPGSLRGLRKCFGRATKANAADLIRWTAERQEKEFASRELPWRDLRGRPMQLIDVQNVFCEVDKYTRLAAPRLSRLAPGKRPKQYYRPAGERLTAEFPPKWRLSEPPVNPVLS